MVLALSFEKLCGCNLVKLTVRYVVATVHVWLKYKEAVDCPLTHRLPDIPVRWLYS